MKVPRFAQKPLYMRKSIVFCRKRIFHSISKGYYGIPYFSRGMLVIWKLIYIYVDWGWKSDFQQRLLLPQSLSRPSLHSHHPRIIHAIEELGLLASKPKDWRLEKNKKIETLGARKNQIASLNHHLQLRIKGEFPSLMHLVSDYEWEKIMKYDCFIFLQV